MAYRATSAAEARWDQVTPFLAFTSSVRKLLYTTNSIESLNYQLRKVTKARGHFPPTNAVVKLLWLAIINIEDKRARERAHPGRQGRRPQRLSRPPHRGPEDVRMARGPQRTRRRLSRTNQVKEDLQQHKIIFTH